MSEIFTGIGFDAHKFGAKKGAWIACLEWPESLVCEGHSDGDVVAHAICDALLSAANLGDLGSNFGTSDPKWAGVSGANLLAEVYKLISVEKFKIENLGCLACNLYRTYSLTCRILIMLTFQGGN